MFIYSIAAKFLSLFMSLVVFCNGISFANPLLGPVKVSYTFSSSEPISAAGTVEVTAPKDGRYDLYWGDAEGNKLYAVASGYKVYYSEFTAVRVHNGSGKMEMNDFAAIPDGAQTILAYKGQMLGSTTPLPQEKIRDAEEPMYRFGALSDVHFNRYHLTILDDATVTFPNALRFLNAFDVSLVGMSGDLSTTSERSAFKKFNYYASQFDFPVLTSTGNHDVKDSFDKADWHEYINPGVYTDKKADGVLDVGVNDLDFVYSPDRLGGDVFIFFSQVWWDYNRPESRLVTDEQLQWLDAQLDKYADRRVYLFFHTFFANPDGNPGTGQGNVTNAKGVYYKLAYTFGTSDEVQFRRILQEHKNVIFFNGHSHWAFSMQKLNSILNITDYDGTYPTMVHIPSVSCCRTLPTNSPTRIDELMHSEGYLVHVYKDHVVLQGVNFFTGELLSYATFVIDK